MSAIKKNIVFIGKSLDGYIAGKKGELDWLELVPNPDKIDMGYGEISASIDALVMGRNTFDTVLSFGIPWPYKKPVFVLSNTMTSVPEGYEDYIEIVNGDLKSVVEALNTRGFNRLYIDGGQVIQNFLKEDLIDEMTITTIPVLLGGGISLFGELDKILEFEHVESKVFLNAVVQDKYKRKK